MSFDPRTPEGRLAREIGSSPGCWKRSGQTATVVGLDWPAALARVPADADRERVEALLRQWEAGMLEGVAEAATKDGNV